MKLSPQIDALRPSPALRQVWYHAGGNLGLPDKPGDLLAPDGMRGTWLLAVLSLSTVSLTGVSCGRSSTASETAPADAAEAFARVLGERQIEPRLTGGYSYVPCRTAGEPGDVVPRALCGSLPPPGSRQSTELAKTLDRVQGQWRKAPGSAAAVHSQGLALLLTRSSPASLDRAITWLSRASTLAPHTAGFANDLAAALVVRAQRLDQPEDLVLALQAAEQAVRIDPQSREARFNRALILENLFLNHAARSAWLGYLRLDSVSDWAMEARIHLWKLAAAAAEDGWEQARASLAGAASRGDRKAVERLLDSYRQAGRELGEEELLGTWAASSLRGDRRAADAALQLARASGAALASLGGDHLLRDAVAAIDESAAHPGQARHLIAGHHAFQEGFLLYRSNRLPEAQARLAAARAELARAGSPFQARADFYGLACAYKQGRYVDALQGLDLLDKDLGTLRYTALRGHIAWLLGLIHSVQGDPVAAIASYAAALERFQEIGEEGNASSAHSLLARPFEQIGQRREAWRHRYLGLRESRSLRSPQARTIAFVAAADASLEQGNPFAALFFQNEVVRHAARHAELEHDPWLLTDALIWRGLIRSRAGSPREAIQDLREAGDLLRRLPLAQSRRMTADAAMIEGLVTLPANPARSAALLTSSLEVYEEQRHRLLILLARKARARAFRLSGDLHRAEEDLRAALLAYEQLGTSSIPERTRLSIVEKTDEIFDEMISLQAVEGHRPADAFTTVDRARTRVLPAHLVVGNVPAAARRQLAGAEPDPLAMSRISAGLPAKTLLVQYAVLEDRVLIWWLRHGQKEPRFAARRISREKLQALCSRVARLPRSERDSAWEPASAALFDLLVSPWWGDVSPGETIAVVDDAGIEAVPFASLRDPRTKLFLVQSVQLLRTPSATHFVTPRAPKRKSPARSELPLAIGNPAFSSHLFSQFGDLPAAAAEASMVAGFLPGTELRIGKAADKPSVLRLMRRASLLHFAGHAELNSRDPLHSFLLLASSPVDSGQLYAWEIYGLDLRATDLVVLSACQTAAMPGSEAEGVTSLARAFLAAGAPRVIASLRKVSDSASYRFFAEFYRHFSTGQDPVDALRATQLHFLTSREETDRAPATWGAFGIMGVNAN